MGVRRYLERKLRGPVRRSLGAFVALSAFAALPSCGDSERAEDDEDSSAGQAGEGTGGGRAGTNGDGEEAGFAGEPGGFGGEAGDGTSGTAGTPNGGRGGSGGASGSSGRGGGNGGGSGAGGRGGAGATGGGSAGGTAGTDAGNGGSGGVDLGIVTFLWGDYRESLDDGTSYVFPAVSLPPAGPDRLVVVAAHTATNVITSFTSLTIGGVAAQKVASAGEDVEPSAPTAFFVARLPTGDVADIQMDLSAGVVRGAIAICGLYGVGSLTPFDTGTATSMDVATIPIDVPMGGVVLASLGMADVATADAGWADMYELYDTVMVEGTPTHISGAMRPAFPETRTFDVLVATASAGYATRAVAVSFR